MDALLGTCDPAELARRKSYKWRTFPPDVLPAFVAEMDFTIAEPIAEAVRDALAIGDTGYPHIGELGEAFAAFAATRLGWEPNPEWVFAVPDVMTGIIEVLTAITPHGSGVVISPPVYGPFALRIGLAGRRVVEAPLRRRDDGGYELDPDVLDRALASPGVSAYLLCSPHNPLGVVWTREQLHAIADLCARHDVALLVDEIHAPLTLPGASFVSFATLDHEMAGRAYVFTSASKGWNIPGMKCAVAVVGSAAAADLLRERGNALLASHLGLLGSVAAFRRGLDWLDAVVAQIDHNRVLLGRLLTQLLPDVGYIPAQASFLSWLDCRSLGLADPAGVFLERGRVAVSSGTDFGTQGAGFVRLNIGTSPDLVTEAVRRMASAVSAPRP